MKTRIIHPAIVGLVALVALSSVPGRAMAEPPLPSPAPPAPAPAVKRSTVALWAAGVAVAGAGTSVVFGVLALRNKSAFDATPTHGSAANGNNDAAYADGALALAVAAGITSLVLFLTDDASHDAEPAAAGARKTSAVFSASPVITPRGGGAGLVIRF
jgi:hypothetical protein